MQVRANADEALLILSAMRDVAGLGRELTEADKASLVAAGHWMFGLDEAIYPDNLAGIKVQRHAVHSVNATKVLFDLDHFNERGSHGRALHHPGKARATG